MAAGEDELKTKIIDMWLARYQRRGRPKAAVRADHSYPSGDRRLDPLIGRHFAWVTASWGQDAPASTYAGLADTYLAHPDFIARYEHIEPGFAEFLAAAMRSWASRQ